MNKNVALKPNYADFNVSISQMFQHFHVFSQDPELSLISMVLAIQNNKKYKTLELWAEVLHYY